jgi:hypothetical protein
VASAQGATPITIGCLKAEMSKVVDVARLRIRFDGFAKRKTLLNAQTRFQRGDELLNAICGNGRTLAYPPTVTRCWAKVGLNKQDPESLVGFGQNLVSRSKHNIDGARHALLDCISDRHGIACGARRLESIRNQMI